MEFAESGGDVLPGLGAVEHSGSRVLNVLEPVQGFARDPRQDSVTIVQTGGDETVNEFFCSGVGE